MSKIEIAAVKGWSSLNFKELWLYRELLYFFTLRDVKIRYKQTVLGIGWAILQPLCTMIVFAFFFGRLANMPSNDIPYPIFAFSGLLPWIFFSNGISHSSMSIIQNQNLVKKIFFPRLVLPTASICGGIIDMSLTFILLLILMPFYEITPNIKLLLFPLAFCWAFIAALGFGLWLSALNVLYRDVKYVVPFMLQIGMFITPIVYPSSLLPENWRLLYAINPMDGVVESFRWMVFENYPLSLMSLSISLMVSLLILVSGAYYFRKVETSFADVV